MGDTLDELHAKFMKNWQYRLWHYILAPKYWLLVRCLRVKHRIGRWNMVRNCQALISELNEIQSLLQAIPAGQDGSGGKTISVSGMQKFQVDIREFRYLFSNWVWSLEEGDFDEATIYLERMRQLARKANNG